MSAKTLLTINTDGAARGNPGPAAFAFVIREDGMLIVEEAGCLGTMTNNKAEYTALVRALEYAVQLGEDRPLLIQSDSELMVKQMRGEYRVKDGDLRVLYDQASKLSDRFPKVTFKHVPRAQNGDADRLCNEALDGQRGPRAPAGPSAKKTSPAKRQARAEGLRDEAIACLRTAATEWAKGNANNPPPEMVWEQLWSILEEEGII